MEWWIIGSLVFACLVIWGIYAVKKEEEQNQIYIEKRLASTFSLGEKLVGVNTPEKVWSLCPHEMPSAVRLLRSETPLWVVPDCSYYQTRGKRGETEYSKHVDTGTVVLTDRHLYFLGTDKERFRVRLDKLVSVEVVYEGIRFQRDGVRARPEVLGADDAHLLAVLILVMENDYVFDIDPDELTRLKNQKMTALR